jgi:tripartite-type tricarboxylate transporter receptor subunit TctC
LPEVPAIAEFYAGFRTPPERIVARRTPPAVIARASAEVQKAVRDPTVAERLERIGVIRSALTPAEFADDDPHDSVIGRRRSRRQG